MKYYKKIQSIIDFLEKFRFDAFDMPLELLKNIPSEIKEAIIQNKNLPLDLSKQQNTEVKEYFVAIDKTKIEIFCSHPKTQSSPKTLEKILIYKTNGLFKPSIITYEKISENNYQLITLDMRKISSQQLDLLATHYSELCTLDPKTEVELRKNGYQFKQQVFSNPKKYYGFKFGGNVYFKELAKKEQTLSMQKFCKIVNQPRGIDFER